MVYFKCRFIYCIQFIHNTGKRNKIRLYIGHIQPKYLSKVRVIGHTVTLYGAFRISLIQRISCRHYSKRKESCFLLLNSRLKTHTPMFLQR